MNASNAQFHSSNLNAQPKVPNLISMNFFSERVENIEEWSWYEKYIVNYYLHDLKLAGRFTPAQIHHAIGLINVNSVALKFPMNAASK